MLVTLSINNLKLHPAIALVVAALIAGVFGLFLGFVVARLSGPYLAGTTLALAVSSSNNCKSISNFGW